MNAHRYVAGQLTPNGVILPARVGHLEDRLGRSSANAGDACRLLADGVDIRIIQLMLGHASVQQTQRYLNVTEHPTAAWTTQQIIDAFPDDTAPRWVLRDRDAIYGDAFRRRISGMGINEVLSSPSSPCRIRTPDPFGEGQV